MNVSVVICTYNRCDSLKDTLDSLLRLENNHRYECEVIIVDNNSTDNTRNVIDGYLPKFNGRLRYVIEKNRGLSFARNRGIEESKGEILIFTDDDVIVDENWLLSMWVCFKTHNCDAVGGRVMPLYDKKTPRWIKKNDYLLTGPLVKYDFGIDVQPHDMGKIAPFIGANMAFKRECFTKYGLFRTDLGAGTKVWSEDIEFFKRISKDAKNLYYCGCALVWHKTDKERTSLNYLFKWYIKAGRYYARTECANERCACCFGIPRYLFRKLLLSFVVFPIIFFNQEKYIETFKGIFLNIGECLEYRDMTLVRSKKVCRK